MAVGHYAMGGGAFGTHVVNALLRDPAALDWFRPWLGWISIVPGMSVLRRFF